MSKEVELKLSRLTELLESKGRTVTTVNPGYIVEETDDDGEPVTYTVDNYSLEWWEKGTLNYLSFYPEYNDGQYFNFNSGHKRADVDLRNLEDFLSWLDYCIEELKKEVGK